MSPFCKLRNYRIQKEVCDELRLKNCDQRDCSLHPDYRDDPSDMLGRSINYDKIGIRARRCK